MARPHLRTDRIDLRPMTLEHLPLQHRLDPDPEVMRLLLGRARTPEEIDELWAPRCADTVADEAGLGWWVAGSRGVMRKIGMRRTRTDARAQQQLSGADQGDVVYEITLEEWRLRQDRRGPRAR